MTQYYRNKIKKKGLKITWVASKLCLSRSTLTAYLLGTRTMPANVETELKKLLK